MSRKEGEFDKHGGRNAFRLADDLHQSSSERAASLRAMRSFTESVEDDVGPPELPPHLDIDVVGCSSSSSMKTSDTNDTIIEVDVKPKVDPQLGETQKYKMAVPGPGHSEQEQELHKSLIRDDDDDAEVEQVLAQIPAAPPTTLSFSEKDPTHEELRREYNSATMQRRRPTTPTSGCVLDGIAFFGGDDVPQPPPEEKIKVSIPAGSRRRRSDMTYSEFYESMASQIPNQKRASNSGRTTPLNDYDGDILEENPIYKDKAPPAPVMHRRSSVEWENFEDFKEQMDVERKAEAEMEKPETNGRPVAPVATKETKKLGFYAKPPTVEVTSPDAPHTGAFHERHDDEDEPTFSEDMVEERKRAKKSRKGDKSDEKPSREDVVHEAPEEEHEMDDVPTASVLADAPEVPEGNVSAVTPSESEPTTDTVEGAYETQPEQEYDPNAYPGYIWNYDTQQWDVDPNYTYEQPAETTQEYAVEPVGQEAQEEYDYSAYGGYDGYMTAHGYVYDSATQAYVHAEGYDPQYYDQNYQYDPATYDQVAYDQTANDQTAYDQSAYHAGYDQPAAQEYSGYDQSQAADETATTEYPATDPYQQAEGHSAYDPNYSYDQSAYHAGYDQNQAYDQTTNPNGNQYSSEYDQNYQNDYSQYAQDDEGQPDPAEYVHEEKSSLPPARPAMPVFTQPLFKEQQKAEDPFSWDAQKSTNDDAASAVSPMAAAPSRPAPPSRPEPPKPDADAAAPPRPPPAQRAPPPRPAPATPKAAPKEPEPEEDAWTQFKKMTEKVSDVVKSTENTLRNLSETSSAKDIKDESYLADIGGSQGFVHDATQREIQRMTDEKKLEKQLKKKLKQQGKKVQSPTFDPDQEDAMDRAAQEIAMKMANLRTDIGDWKPPPGMEIKKPVLPPPPAEVKRQDSASAIPPRKKSSIKDVQQDSGGSLELPAHLAAAQQDSIIPKGDLAPDDPILSAPAWADFDASDPSLPPSESGFFSNKDVANEASSSDLPDPFVTTTASTNNTSDPFAPVAPSLIDDSYDPFAVRPVEDIVAMAKAKAEEAAAAGGDDDDFFADDRHSPALSTPTPEGGSPLSQRPNRFDDDFKLEQGMGLETPTPLYEEDDSEPLTEFIPKFAGEGWELMIRHPIKKKSFMADRNWKPCFVRLHGTTLFIYNDKKDSSPIQELLLQATYSLSDTTLQAYDVYGKIHTVKLQYVVYKEKVGIRPGQISRLVEGHVTKYGLPLEHTAQCTVLLKFGSLNAAELQSFVTTVEDVLFKCNIARTTKPIYKQDEVQIHCYDEYSAFVDKDGVLSDQKARVRMFCLAFLSGTPFLEIGLNDRRRQGKEIVRRKDILPMHTERWIRFEALEFHSIIDRNEFDKEQVITFSPPDGCFFEIMRFRVRPPRNREKAMTAKAVMKIAGSRVEIRIEAMAAAQVQRTRGAEERRTIPCEDIAIRFPIPEAWIYIFREERHWGVGSVHSKKLRPGKVKNLKDRLLGAVQTSEPNLIECAIGEAKYEHVFRSLVWRIPRLPEKHHAAYKSHLLRCRFDLSSFDLMPEAFLPRCDVEFTMPLATVSNTVVRSVSVEQHEDSDRVEKFVRYVAKYQYKVEIDYVQCANLDIDTADPSVNVEAAAAPVPQLHQPQFQPDSVQQVHEGYRIDFDESEMGRHDRKDSSSDEEMDSHKMPIIQIDMKNYGY